MIEFDLMLEELQAMELIKKHELDILFSADGLVVVSGLDADAIYREVIKNSNELTSAIFECVKKLDKQEKI
jgi:hypothetical protein